jgi:zinc transporter
MSADDPSPIEAPPALQAGADGLVWAYRFGEDGVTKIIDDLELRAALERQDSWLWLHFDLDVEPARASISALPHLPPAAVAMLLGDDERQQIDTFGQVVAGVAADYEPGETLDVRHVVRWQFVMTPRLFVSARRQPGHTLRQARIDLERGRTFDDVLDLFSAIVHEFATATFLLLRDVSDRLDAMEVQLVDGKEVGGSEALGQARRSLIRLRRQAAPMRAVLVHMLTEPPDWFSDAAAGDCRRVVERMDDLMEDLDAFQERARALGDELNGVESEKINRRLTLLSVVSALLLPPTFITGLFGMNVGGLPWRASQLGFADTCLLMALSVAVMLLILKRIRLI